MEKIKNVNVTFGLSSGAYLVLICISAYTVCNCLFLFQIQSKNDKDIESNDKCDKESILRQEKFMESLRELTWKRLTIEADA